MFFARRRKIKNFNDLSPDEIFVDASNLPAYDQQQFEGRMERAIGRQIFYGLAVFCGAVFLIFFGRLFWLAAINGDYYAERSRNNNLNLTSIFATRGNVYDRDGRELAWTVMASTTESESAEETARRTYIASPGFGHLLGYVGFPNQAEFATGQYHGREYLGRSGIEQVANELLHGTRGERIVEVDATGKEESDHVVKKAVPGQSVTLSIDSRIQAKMYQLIEQVATERGFRGGAGLIMDLETGELITMVSYPDFDPNVLSAGEDREKINQYFNSSQNTMLNRAVSGLYTPGSTFKPFVALGALSEKTVDPLKKFVTNGRLEIVNPYNKTQTTVFRDWRNNGTVDMRRALAVSSNVYFYIIGGGFGSQPGLGIKMIEKYAKLFGLSQLTGVNLPGEASGTIPSPEWKAANFDGEPWRLGDTYHTSIGQYGVQVTPIQLLRAYAAIGNGGRLIKPTVFRIDPTQAVIQVTIAIKPEDLQVIRDGLRQVVADGTASALRLPGVAVSAKTGSAELGVAKDFLNASVAGYWPSEAPRYAFTVVLERGPRDNLVGGVAVMSQLLAWMQAKTPEYFN
ncbi:MAG: hypothetical protein COV08_02120 [Candidatus Vogelbacteria bacterium CG10_big_fil_rev_8_21_14_0_10_49_38]|uniref:Penicillin-binding protein 2 n=1 Tax=Candidatus Vogelbacteria bacterium CG10_big_fil_rev_8_21_14_0_10_49_38 TaxID=1975043 RepID=A0A2H0RHQ5_9BACT|nr:MAG: hypothetical protein BK006_02140 [bacterium CG10_49_38]PIR45987.1 MAG: hypothetical protein COV08_02120 [Candidatus Vogelbacteria bacterium CG10_big_fil_rev_8_21_14_0_10_49_38]